MKVSVAGGKVFIYGDLYNETLEIEKPDEVEIFVVGCNIKFKNSIFLKLWYWIKKKTFPSCGISLNSLEKSNFEYELKA
jgi:hypothetical protein